MCNLQSTTMKPPTQTTPATIHLVSTSTNLRHNRKQHADLNANSTSERGYITMRKRFLTATNLGTYMNGYLNNRRPPGRQISLQSGIAAKISSCVCSHIGSRKDSESIYFFSDKPSRLRYARNIKEQSTGRRSTLRKLYL